METQNNNRVVIVDVAMPFWSMVIFMVKWTMAAIPAFIILAILGSLFFSLMGGLFSHFWGHFGTGFNGP